MLSTAAMHERVYGRREDAAKPTCMSARALARLAVPRKLTSTVRPTTPEANAWTHFTITYIMHRLVLTTRVSMLDRRVNGR